MANKKQDVSIYIKGVNKIVWNKVKQKTIKELKQKYPYMEISTKTILTYVFMNYLNELNNDNKTA